MRIAGQNGERLRHASGLCAAAGREPAHAPEVGVERRRLFGVNQVRETKDQLVGVPLCCGGATLR